MFGFCILTPSCKLVLVKHMLFTCELKLNKMIKKKKKKKDLWKHTPIQEANPTYYDKAKLLATS